MQLVEELVCHKHAQTVLPGLCQHVGERERYKGLALVNVEEERPALMLRLFSPVESCKLYGGNEHGAEERTGILANLPLAKVAYQYLAAIQNLLHTEAVRFLPYNIAERDAGEKQPGLVQYRGDSLGAKSSRVLQKLILPKCNRILVLHIGKYSVSVQGVGKEWLNVQQGCVRVF